MPHNEGMMIKSIEQKSESTRNFDLFRLSNSKAEVNLCSNTIRSFAKAGLRIYRLGRVAMVSKAELDAFIRSRG